MIEKRCYIYDWDTEYVDDNLVIHIFGIDSEKKNICLHIHDFQPYFYVEVPIPKMNKAWTMKELEIFAMIPELAFGKTQPEERTVTRRKKLYYYNTDTFLYIEYKCKSNQWFRDIARMINSRQYLTLLVNNISNLSKRTEKHEAILKYLRFNRKPLKTHEHDASAVLQFVSSNNIPTCGWVDFKSDERCIINDTLCNETYIVKTDDLTRCHGTCPTPLPYVISWDIETYSSNPKVMPKAEIEENCVFQISLVCWRGDEKKNILLTLGTPIYKTNEIVSNLEFPSGAKKTALDPFETIVFETEKDLLLGFTNIILQENPNVLTGYNILGFDIPYMMKRAEMLNISETFMTMGMISGKVCDKISKEWSSSAFKHQNFQFIDTAGRIWIDVITVVRRDYKLPNYKLDTVSHEFLHASKDPIKPKHIFQSFEIGVLNPTKEGTALLGDVGFYCVKDSILVRELFNYFDVWFGLTETASVCNVPITDVLTKGQQIRVYSQVYKYCYNNDIIVENGGYKNAVAYDKEDEEEETKYEGAFVKEPIAGLYDYVVPFDFASLYPTTIIAYNIDYSTLVPDKDTSIPDSECNVIEWTTNDKEYRFRFKKEPKGILPTIIQNLLDARAEVRKQMKTCDPSIKSVLNKRQLSFKVSANSMYGALGTVKGYLPFMPGAMCITAMGRENIQKAARYLESNYPATVIYQDTDSCYTVFPSFQNRPIDLWEYSAGIEQDMWENEIFPRPIRLEFEEKIYGKFLILTKKRYLWRQFTREGEIKDKIDFTGVMLARRDNCEFERKLYRKIVTDIFNGKGENEILYDITRFYNQCCGRCFPVEDFVVTKSVNDIASYKIRELPEDEEKREKRLKKLECTEAEYESRAIPAIAQLSERMRKRGLRVDNGQRIEYVIIDNHRKLLVDKVEDVDYFIEHRHVIDLDYLHYVSLNQVRLSQLMEVVFNWKGMKEMHKSRKYKDLMMKEFYTRYASPIHIMHPEKKKKEKNEEIDIEEIDIEEIDVEEIDVEEMDIDNEPELKRIKLY